MRELPILLFGAGGVGRALVRQIVAQRALHARHYGLALAVVAVTDRDGGVLAFDDELSDATLLDLVHAKEQGGRLAEHPQGAPQHDLAAIVDVVGRPGAVVVDCTATEHTAPALLFALERGYRVALANKKPLTLEQEVYERLTRAGGTGLGPRRGVRQTHIRWEATCGAGLPVVVTLDRLLASGDPVHRIAGALSGTLGYVMTGLQEGRSFSAVVREAHRLGYTEPDPRDDLGGVDVARKALILARGLGWRLELHDVAVTGLYPPTLDALSVDEFLDALAQLDEPLRQDVEAAQRAGQVLRYAAVVADGRCTVGPTLVGADSPLGRLAGTDNLVEFHTRWYQPTPLVVQGRGAGADATAAGVLSDIVDLAFCG